MCAIPYSEVGMLKKHIVNRLRYLFTVINEAFNIDNDTEPVYNKRQSTIWHSSDLIFLKDYSLLESMNMLVPINSQEAASYSKVESSEYIPLHKDNLVQPHYYYKLLHSNLSTDSLPENIRMDMLHRDGSVVEFSPEVNNEQY